MKLSKDFLQENSDLQTSEEELANILTHGIGVMLSMVGIIMIFNNIKYDTIELFIGLCIFCFALLSVYLSSTVYHIISLKKPHLKLHYQKLDHMAIYFLIAGTHTPFIIKYLSPPINNYILLGLWSFVFLGIIFKLFFTGKFDNLSLALYLLLGWSAAFTLPFMFHKMELFVLIWIIIGGISYTAGIIFYKWHSLKFNHSIWHIFVLFGSVSHFISIYALL